MEFAFHLRFVMAQLPSTFSQRLYALLLHLYPPSFQREFKAEMVEVFCNAAQQERRRGFRHSLAFFLKELVDLPSSLLGQYGWVLFSKEKRLTGALDLGANPGGMSASLGFSDPQPSSWKELLLAALPFLAVAYTGLTTMLYGLGVVSRESSFLSVLSIVLAVGMLLVALGTFVYAWRKRFPRWSAPWYGFWLFALLAPLALLNNFWDPPQFFYFVVQPLLWGSILLGLAWFLYRLSCRDAVKGILAALPLMGLTWTFFQEFVRDDLEGAIALASWLLIALAAVVIVRLNTLKAGVLLALGVNFLIGLAYAYEGTYFGGTLNFDAPGPNWIQVLRTFLPHWVGISTLVIGPLLARRYRELGYRLQPAGLILYRLVLAGLLLILVANLANTLVYTTDDLRYQLQNEDQVLNSIAWVGLAVFLLGMLFLSRKVIQEKVPGGIQRLWLLGIFSVLLPYGMTLGLPHRLIYPALSLSDDFSSFLYRASPISQFPELWEVSFGFLWALAAAGLAVALNTAKKPAGS
jgi:hypothetical protein